MKDSLTEDEGVGEFFARVRIQATYNVSSLLKGLIRQVRKLFTVYRSISIIEVETSKNFQKMILITLLLLAEKHTRYSNGSRR